MTARTAIAAPRVGTAPTLTLTTLAVGLVLGLGAPAPAQTIRIPDFRNEGAPANMCADCGIVRSVREISTRRGVNVPPGVGRPPGASGGPGSESNLVGGVFMHSFGAGSSETFVGGVGTPEMQQRLGETGYEITVRMADGSYRRIERRDGSRFQVGDRVRLTQGAIEHI